MKIKKYVGRTAHEAMLKLKADLGPDAVVLSTKTVRAKGLFKVFKKPLVEITAAYEARAKPNRSTTNNYEDKLSNINQELAELKRMVKGLPLQVEDRDEMPENLKEFEKRLLANGIDRHIVENLLKDINKEFNLEDKDRKTIENIIRYNIMEYLGNPKPITIDGEQKIIFFVGPTGVGKTTTLAKIAASLVVSNKYKIGLVTSDTYRIGAVDQLKIYSDILNLPLKVAYNEADMDQAFDEFKDKDIILVDTAGRSHNNMEQIEELKDIINSTFTKDIYLLVSATINKKVLDSLLSKYDFLEDFNLIITKIDEAEDYGNIFNIRYMANKELSYYTTGQSVPDDIQVIDKEFIAKKLTKENENNGPS